MTNKVAEIILMQMGGQWRLRIMIGAHHFVAGKNLLQFGFKGCRKFNKCRVVLNGDDTYTLGLHRLNRLTLKSVDYEVSGLYFDQLKHEFERATGLYLTI